MAAPQADREKEFATSHLFLYHTTVHDYAVVVMLGGSSSLQPQDSACATSRIGIKCRKMTGEQQDNIRFRI
jgi:hypothetical protein